MSTGTLTLIGEKTRLRPVTEEDVQMYVSWNRDPEFLRWFGRSENESLTLEERELERWKRNESDETRRDWTIETLDGKPIGNINLQNIALPHGLAELGISIGEKEYWSSGYGTDALKLLLREAFETLGLRRIMLMTDADNERGLRCYEKCGFVREGVLREHRKRDGQPLDMVVMGILRSEWEAQQ